MEKGSSVAKSLIVSTRLYQALLTVYPSEFRQEYGGPMLQVFRSCGQKALQDHGSAGLLSLWKRTMLDTVKTAIEEHARRGVDMSREKFIKLSGWALILSGFAILMSDLAAQRPEYSPYNALSLPIDRYANAVAFPLFGIGALLLITGCIGLFVRYGQRAGRFGQVSLGLAVFSGLIGAIGLVGIGDFTSGDSWWAWWRVLFLGWAFQFLGIALFGITALRQHLLPRWNGLPIFAGTWVPLYIFVSIGMELSGSGWPESQVANLLMLILTLTGLVGLGYLVTSDARSVGRASGTV